MAEPMTHADEVEYLVAGGMSEQEAEDYLASIKTTAAMVTPAEVEQQRAELRNRA